jgi:hypothetical protein
MRRTFTLLLGLWVFTAPAVCGAACIDGPTPADHRVPAADPSPTTELPTNPCHQMAGGDRNEQDTKDHSAPTSDDDCCAEGHSNSFQIKAPPSPLKPLAHTFWAPGGLTSFQFLVVSEPPRTEIDCTQSPYFRANPPLLI